MNRIVVASALCGALSLAAASVAQAQQAVAPGFYSLEVDNATPPAADVQTSKLGLGRSSYWTSRQPAFSFAVTKPTKVVWRLHGNTPQAYLVNVTNNKFWSIPLGYYKKSKWSVVELAPGNYGIHYAQYSQRNKVAGARLEIYERVPMEVALADKFSPNPMKISARTDLPLQNVRVGGEAPCKVALRPEQPAVVLDLAAPQAKLRLTTLAGRAVHGWLVRHGGGDHCQNRQGKSFEIENLPKGRVELYPLRWGNAPRLQRHPKGNLFVDFTIEDLSRARPVAWSAPERAHELAGSLQKPIFVAGTAPKEGGELTVRCQYDNQTFSDAATLKITKPVDVLKLRFLTLSRLRFAIAGPYGPDNRRAGKQRTECFRPSGVDATQIKDLLPGVYRLGVKRDRQEGSVKTGEYRIALFDPTSEVDRFSTYGAVPENLSLHHRLLSRHIPFFEWKGKGGFQYLGPTRRQKMFLVAPKQLFVYPKYDLTKEKTRYEGPSVEAVRYPKANEPLLVVSTRSSTIEVITADGLLFHAPTDRIALEPSGPLSVPAEVPSFELGSSNARALATKEDRPRIEKFEKLQARFNKCQDKIWSKHSSGRANLYRYDLVTYRRGRIAKVQNYGDLVSKKAYRQCGGKRVEKAQTALLKTLSSRFEDRLQKGLDEVRAKLLGK